MARRDIESQTRSNDNDDATDSIGDLTADANVEAPTPTNQEGLPEVEAYLVEEVEEEVYTLLLLRYLGGNKNEQGYFSELCYFFWELWQLPWE